jgi:hypothetical protein
MAITAGTMMSHGHKVMPAPSESVGVGVTEGVWVVVAVDVDADNIRRYTPAPSLAK